MTAWGDNRIDLIRRGSDSSFLHKWWDGKQFKWQPSKESWKTIPSKNQVFTQEPAVATWGPDSLKLFTINAESVLWCTTYNRLTDQWEEGTCSISPSSWSQRPAVISQYPKWLKVVLVGYDNEVYELTYNGKTWSSPLSLDGSVKILDPPKLISWGPDRLDLFARGTDGVLRHKAWSETGGWGNWEGMGLNTKIIAPPNGISYTPKRLDIFVIGEGGVLWRNAYDGTKWGQWVDIDGPWRGVPEVLSWGPGRIDLFLAEKTNRIHHTWFDKGEWQPKDRPQCLPHLHIGDRVTAVSSAKERIDLFFVDPNGKVGYQHYSRQMGWQPSRTTYENLGGASIFRIATSS